VSERESLFARRPGAPHGLMDDEMTPYLLGVNCLHCGRFVGRDGWISVDYFEMSSEVASVEGQCGKCLREAVADAR
jgi:hypothetical protein